MRAKLLPGATSLWGALGLTAAGVFLAWNGGEPLLVSGRALDPVEAWWWLAAVALGAGFGDALLVARPPRLEVSRSVPGTLPLGVPCRIRLRIDSAERYPHAVRCADHHPPAFTTEDPPARCTVAPGHSVTLGYSATPGRRGEHRFGPVQLRVRSPLGFWWRQLTPDPGTRVRVYPNFAPVAKYIRLGTDERLSRVGVRRLPRRGSGSEFHELRDYRRGDPMRQIDWRATARVRRLISRDYQDERDQRVIFMLDCGRRMRTADGRLSHFDHSLNAVLLLAYMALRQGDSVAIGTFGNGPDGRPRWMAPVKGATMVNRVLNNLYDLEPSTAMPDYAAAAAELLVRHRKHALVVVVTDVRSEDVDDLVPALDMLKSRHLVLVTSLRQRVLESALESEVHSLGEAVRVSAAHGFARERTRGLRSLRQAGVLTLDVAPDALSAELVNAYLAIKSSRTL